MVGVGVQYEIVDSDPNMDHVTEDVLVSESAGGRILLKEIHGVEQIPDGVYGDVEDAFGVDQRPKFLSYKTTDTKQG
jgi:hypothetical protein